MSDKNNTPNAINSNFKLWIALKGGGKVNMFSFPKEDKQMRNNEASIFARMFKRILVDKFNGQYQNAIFFDVRANKPVYSVDAYGNVERVN